MQPSSVCTRCGETCQKLESRGNPPIIYCAACGWNVSTAQIYLANVRFGIRFLGILYTILLSIGIAASPSRKNSLEDGILLLIFLAGMAWFMQRRISRDARRLALIQATATDQERDEPEVVKAGAVDLSEFDRVRSLARPRSIRLNPASRSALLLMKVIPVGMCLWGIHDLIFPRHPIGSGEQTPFEARAYSIGLCVLGVIMWWLFDRSFEKKSHLEILRNGEVALARITRAVSRKAVSPVVEYAFSVPNGSLVHGQGEDIGGSHNEGEYLIVLYERQMPEKSLPMCATNYEFPKS